MRIEPEIRDNVMVSRTTYDIDKGETVPAIASFDDTGQIVPLYLRINGQSHRVLNYIRKNEGRRVAIYQCDIEDNGKRKWLRVKYCYEEGVWMVMDD